MTAPLVSVIMPVYNAEPFVAHALESVLAQDYEPVEVLAVNDGSTDRSGEIARSYPGIRYFEHENRGASPSRNFALSQAAGEFVAFVDADDWVPPQKLSVQVGYLLEHLHVAATLGRQEWITPPPDAARDKVWGDLDGIPLLSMVIRRSVLVEMGGFQHEVGGDMDLMIRMRAAGHEFTVLPQLVLRRRYHGGNLFAGQGLAPLPLEALKAKLDRERAARAGGEGR